MKINSFAHFTIAVSMVLTTFASVVPDANAQIDMKKRPSLVITSDKMAATPRPTPPYNRTVSTPAVMMPAPMSQRDDSMPQISGGSAYQQTQTIVGEKVNGLRSDLSSLQSRVSSLSGQLKSLKDRNKSLSSEYNDSIATINTQLQTGTTPGNPRLVEKLSIAQGNLDRMSQNVADLNSMAVEAANAASMGSYLLEACRSAYGLSGAVEEEHAALAQVEDQANTTMVALDRVLNEINDDITRTAAYMSAEQSNLRTLSLAVTNGDYYGRSLANRPFSNAPASTLQSGGMMQPASMSSGGMMPMNSPAPVTAQPLSTPRPLVKIKFDQPNVDYEQAVYMAVNDAQQKYPNARFELIAVNPTAGNAAQVAIESTRARRNAEMVLRSLSQMGINMNKIDLSTQQSAEAKSNEVHIFIR